MCGQAMFSPCGRNKYFDIMRWAVSIISAGACRNLQACPVDAEQQRLLSLFCSSSDAS